MQFLFKIMKFFPTILEGIDNSKKIGAQKKIQFYTFLSVILGGRGVCSSSVFAKIRPSQDSNCSLNEINILFSRICRWMVDCTQDLGNTGLNQAISDQTELNRLKIQKRVRKIREMLQEQSGNSTLCDIDFFCL